MVFTLKSPMRMDLNRGKTTNIKYIGLWIEKIIKMSC